MSTLLVTGAAGFIGSNFVRVALQNGHKVIGLDSLTYAGRRENLENLPHGERFKLIVDDIRSPHVGDLFQAIRPDAVLNFAAESHVDRSISNPMLFVETNVLGTGNLLHHSLPLWREKPSFRYLQVSTDEVYGSLSDTGKFNENSPLAPSSPYSASKAAADHLVNAWHHTYGLPTVITRCSNNYGPHQFPEKLIPHMIRCAIAGESLPVYGDGSNVRDWIHVEDHCEGILQALLEGKAGSTYCLGGNHELRNIDLVKAICGELDRTKPRADGQSYETQIKFVTDRLGHDYRYAIDDTHARAQIGFVRKHDFEGGLRATVSWYLNNESWIKAVTAIKI
jgi:dTDP-glucose 4,6-dehydratase